MTLIMNLFGIIGNPVNHSKSPAIMNAAFKALHINAKYVKIAGDSVRTSLRTMQELGFNGVNITSPYKEEIIPFLDKLDQASEQVGGVNTIVFEKDQLCGYNTDYFGVIDSLKASKIDLRDKNVLVLGAGGAAKAAIFGLLQENAKVSIVNRTYEKANEISDQFDIKCLEWEELNHAIKNAEVIINTISSTEIDVDLACFSKNQTLFDANYHYSQFVEIASQVGCKFIDGKSWLLHQAFPAFKYFINQEAPKEIMQTAFESKKETSNISLIGFMGSGKTSIGKELAKKLKYTFVDIDKLIEKKEGKLIKDIFDENEEDYFRKIEEIELNEVLKKDKQVISCGGGIITNLNNRNILEQKSQVIWLYANVLESIKRLKSDKRPLLNVENKEEKAVNLFNERKQYYAGTCDIIFNTTNFNKEQITQKIYEEISFSI